MEKILIMSLGIYIGFICLLANRTGIYCNLKKTVKAFPSPLKWLMAGLVALTTLVPLWAVLVTSFEAEHKVLAKLTWVLFLLFIFIVTYYLIPVKTKMEFKKHRTFSIVISFIVGGLATSVSFTLGAVFFISYVAAYKLSLREEKATLDYGYVLWPDCSQFLVEVMTILNLYIIALSVN